MGCDRAIEDWLRAACVAIVPRPDTPLSRQPFGRFRVLDNSFRANGTFPSTGLQHEGGIAMRTVSINLDLPQSAELSATLVQMCLSERDPVIKAMLENILEQLRQDYAKKGP